MKFCLAEERTDNSALTLASPGQRALQPTSTHALLALLGTARAEVFDTALASAAMATPAPDVRPDAAADELAGTLRRHGGCAPRKGDIDVIAVLSRDPGARRRRTATGRN